MDLVDDEDNVVAESHFTKTLEERWRGVVIAAFRLDGLHHNCRHGVVERCDKPLGFLEASSFLFGVGADVILERVAQLWKGCAGPIEGRDVEFVDRLAAGGSKTAKETTVESTLERENGVVWASRGFVQHRRLDFLRREVDPGSSPVHLGLPHTSCLVGRLVGIGTIHRGEDLVKAWGCSFEDSLPQCLEPVSGRKAPKGRTVDQRADHLRTLSRLHETRVVVSNWN